MKTLTVRLPDVLVSEIERESRTRRVSKSDVVRERLHQPRRPSDGGGSMGELIGDILQASWRAQSSRGPPPVSLAQKTKTGGDHPCQKTASLTAAPWWRLLDPREEHHALGPRKPCPGSPCRGLPATPFCPRRFFLLHPPHARAPDQLLRRGHLRLAFNLNDELPAVLDLRAKYADVPMSLADACLVGLTETLRQSHPNYHRRRF